MSASGIAKISFSPRTALRQEQSFTNWQAILCLLVSSRLDSFVYFLSQCHAFCVRVRRLHPFSQIRFQLSSWLVAYSIALLREPERPAGTPLITTVTHFSPAVTMS
jgi:hypothetical protein